MQDFPDWGKPVRPTLFTPMGSGVTLLSATGTRAMIRSATPTGIAIIKARRANVGTVYLGTSAVTNDESSTTGGLQLDPGDFVVVSGTNLGDLYINGTAGDGISYAWWV